MGISNSVRIINKFKLTEQGVMLLQEYLRAGDELREIQELQNQNMTCLNK